MTNEQPQDGRASEIKVGDRVRLKAGSELRDLLGKAADLVGTVGATAGGLIWVDWPEVPLYGQALAGTEFEVVDP